MQSETNPLYTQMILDYYKNPINFGKLKKCTVEAHGGNISCGDTMDIYLTIDKKIIKDVSFEGEGCAISRAGACIFTELIKGKSVDEVLAMNPEAVTNEMGGIIQTRIRCVLLALNVTKKALAEWKKDPQKKIVLKGINI